MGKLDLCICELCKRYLDPDKCPYSKFIIEMIDKYPKDFE